jgi:hypothetical protein
MSTLLKRKFFCEQLYHAKRPNGIVIHKLTQKIFVEAFQYLKNNQHELAQVPNLLSCMIQGTPTLIPPMFLDGFIQFVSLKTVNALEVTLFTESMVAMIQAILNPDNLVAQQPLMTREVALQLVQSPVTLIVERGLPHLSPDDSLRLLAQLGKSDSYYERVLNQVQTLDDQIIRETLISIHSNSPDIFDLIRCFANTRRQSKLYTIVATFFSSKQVPSETVIQFDDDKMEVVDNIPTKVQPGELQVQELQDLFHSFSVTQRDTKSLSFIKQKIVSILQSNSTQEFVQKVLPVLNQFMNMNKPSAVHMIQLLVSMLGDNVNQQVLLDWIKQTLPLQPNLAHVIASGLNQKQQQEFAPKLLAYDSNTQLCQQLLNNPDCSLVPLVHLLNQDDNSMVLEGDVDMTSQVNKLVRNGTSEAQDILIQHYMSKNEKPLPIADLIRILSMQPDHESVVTTGTKRRQHALHQVSSYVNRYGLMIDIITYLDPAIKNVTLRDILFQSTTSDLSTPLSPLLMQLLLANNPSKELVALWNSLNEECNSQNALMFLSALIQKLTVYTSNHTIVETSFDMSRDQAVRITKWILKCMQTLPSLLHNNKQIMNTLLHAVTIRKFDNLATVVQYLLTTKDYQRSTELLMWLYTCYPEKVSTSILSQQQSNSISMVPTSLTTHLDPVMHRLVYMLNSSHSDFSMFGYSMFRQLATLHPTIVCKYLPNLATLLESTHGMTPSEFILKGLVKPYLQVLGILDALRPLVFQVTHFFNYFIIHLAFISVTFHFESISYSVWNINLL